MQMGVEYMAISVIILITVAMLAAPLEAQRGGSWQFVFVGRTFLQVSPGLREVPLMAVGLDNNRAGIVTVISNDSMRIIVAEANSSIVASTVIELEGALPFCAVGYGGSVEVLVKKRQTLRSFILTEEGNIVEGINALFSRPFFPSGCVKENFLYLVYGGAVTENEVDPAVYAYRPNGEVAWEAYVALPGIESVYDLIVSGGMIYAVVANASDGTLSLYALQDENLVLLRHLGRYDYLSGTSLGDGGLALLLSNSTGAMIVEYYPERQARIVSLPELYVAESLAYSDGTLLVSGWTLNTTTGLADGVLLALDPSGGEILARSIVYGADDVRLPVIAPVGGGAILAAGTHGNQSMLLGFLLQYTEPAPTAPPTDVEVATPVEGEPISRYIPIMVILIVLAVLAVYIRARPSLGFKRKAPKTTGA